MSWFSNILGHHHHSHGVTNENNAASVSTSTSSKNYITDDEGNNVLMTNSKGEQVALYQETVTITKDDGFFASKDKNGDGELTKSEYRRQGLGLRIFGKFRDGKTFGKMDADGNGKVTKEEYLNSDVGKAHSTTTTSVRQGATKYETIKAADTNVATASDTFKAEHANLVSTAGAVKTRQQVTDEAYEIKMETADVNKDGNLTTEEITNAQNAARQVRLDEFDKVDTNKDGTVNSYEMTNSHTQWQTDNAATVKTNFYNAMPNLKDADKNGDNVIERSEVSGTYSNDFNAVDKNADGKISLSEMEDYSKNGSFAAVV